MEYYLTLIVVCLCFYIFIQHKERKDLIETKQEIIKQRDETFENYEYSVSIYKEMVERYKEYGESLKKSHSKLCKSIKECFDKDMPFKTHPSEIFFDEVEFSRMDESEIKEKLSLDNEEFNKFKHGNLDVDIELAKNMNKVVGMDARFWLRAQYLYDINNL